VRVVDAVDGSDGAGGDVAVSVPLAPRRRTVLLAVRRLEPATIEVIANDLGMTPSGARQHVQALAAIGLVSAEPVARAAGGRGRPQLAYSLTEAGEAALPKRYRDLSQELLGYLDDEDPGVLDRVFQRRRDARIANAEERLAAKGSLAEKVTELTAILDEDGYLASVAVLGPGELRIDEHNCAISAVARRYGQACTSELDFIRRVLPEAEVRRVHHMNAGDRSCAYEVVARGAGGYRQSADRRGAPRSIGPRPPGGASPMRWIEHGERSLYESPWMSLRLVDVEIPGDSRFDHHVVRFPNHAAGTVVHDPDRGAVLLLWRHRFITDSWGWELPAGNLDPGEAPEAGAVREALEESGWRPSALEHLLTYHPMPGAVDQTFHLFYASRAEEVGPPVDTSEAERVEWVPVTDVRDGLLDGRVSEGMSLTALSLVVATGRLT